MRVVVVDAEHPDPEALAEAGALLRAGGLVAFPTETVYGLGAHALDPVAVHRIYEAKGRPSHNPLIVHVAGPAEARRVVREWPERAERLAAAFWPGPLTLVLPRHRDVPDEVTGGGDTVAVRVPAHPVALGLLRAAGVPVAAPSANRSTEVSPTTARHVVKGLGDRVDLVLDGGPTRVGIESTVVDLSGATPVLLRPGMLGPAELEPIVGMLALPGPRAEGESALPSPGMLERHYAPRARLVLFDPHDAAELARARRSVADARALGRRTGALVIAAEPAEVDEARRLPADPHAYAQRLYDALHTLDDAGCDVVIVERVPDGPAWLGVRDRLERAAK